MVHRETLDQRPHLPADQAADIVLYRLGRFNLSVLAVVDRRDVSQILGAVTLEDLLEMDRNGSA